MLVWVIVDIVVFLVICNIIYNGVASYNWGCEYTGHVDRSKQEGDDYVVLPFDSLLNMWKVDKTYFKSYWLRDCCWTVYHQETHVVQGRAYYNEKKTYVIMPTKDDYKKLKQYLGTSDEDNTNNRVYDGSSDEAMNNIIEHFHEVVEKRKEEALEYSSKAEEIYHEALDNMKRK